MADDQGATDPQDELTVITEAVNRTFASLRAAPDSIHAYRTAEALARLADDIRTEANDVRNLAVAGLHLGKHAMQKDLARVLGLSPGWVSTMVRDGREAWEKMHPPVDPLKDAGQAR